MIDWLIFLSICWLIDWLIDGLFIYWPRNERDRHFRRVSSVDAPAAVTMDVSPKAPGGKSARKKNRERKIKQGSWDTKKREPYGRRVKGRKTWEQQHQRDHVSGGFNEAATPTSLTAALERLRVTVLFFLSFPSLISAQELTVAHDYSRVRELNQRVRYRVALKPEATNLNIRWGGGGRGAKLLPRNTLTWHDDREIVMEFFSIIRRVRIGTNAKNMNDARKRLWEETRKKSKKWNRPTKISLTHSNLSDKSSLKFWHFPLTIVHNQKGIHKSTR